MSAPPPRGARPWRFLVPAVLLAFCSGTGGGRCVQKPDGGARQGEDAWAALREKMVAEQIEARGVRDPRVLAAMRAVPRHLFVPEGKRAEAYEDYPLPIGEGQTISQPYIVAVMSEAMLLSGKERVLEVGTGSGYQAAVLSLLAREVYSIEIVGPLAARSKALLASLGYANITVTEGDGYEGVPGKAPFDAIMITAAPPAVPAPLKEQLAVGGRLVLPVGKKLQSLERITRTGADAWRDETILPSVIFVPMTGQAQHPPEQP